MLVTRKNLLKQTKSLLLCKVWWLTHRGTAEPWTSAYRPQRPDVRHQDATLALNRRSLVSPTEVRPLCVLHQCYCFANAQPAFQPSAPHTSFLFLSPCPPSCFPFQKIKVTWSGWMDPSGSSYRHLYNRETLTSVWS